MKEWNELYRDMLSAYNALAEAIATAKTLHERDTRRIAELEADLRELRENVLLGLGMTAEDVAEMDDDSMEPSISFLLSGYQEVVTELAALKAGEWLPPDTVRESGPVQIILNAQAVDFFFYSPDESGRMIFKDSIVAWRPAPPQE